MELALCLDVGDVGFDGFEVVQYGIDIVNLEGRNNLFGACRASSGEAGGTELLVRTFRHSFY